MDTRQPLDDQRAQMILAHLCGDRCHGFGQVVELCESRNDCIFVVTCPTCGERYSLDDELYDQLVAWSAQHSHELACGITPL